MKIGIKLKRYQGIIKLKRYLGSHIRVCIWHFIENSKRLKISKLLDLKHLVVKVPFPKASKVSSSIFIMIETLHVKRIYFHSERKAKDFNNIKVVREKGPTP